MTVFQLLLRSWCLIWAADANFRLACQNSFTYENMSVQIVVSGAVYFGAVSATHLYGQKIRTFISLIF